MNKLIILCFVSTLIVSDILSATHNGIHISTFFNNFKHNATTLLQNIEYEKSLSISNRLSMEIENELCLRQMNTILNAFKNSEMWAIKVIDAWGKIPAGILNGNFYEFGQFDECIATEKSLGSEDMNTFRGQYCLAQIGVELNPLTRLFDQLDEVNQLKITSPVKGSDAKLLPTQTNNTLGLKIGICVPDSCSSIFLTQIINNVLNVSKINASGFFSSDLCHTSAPRNFNKMDISTISFFGVIVLLMITSTIYDIITTYYQKNKRLGLTAFSMYTNGQKLFNCKKSSSYDVMDCLNGIRVLSIVWIVFGHTHMMFVVGPLINLSYANEWVSHAYSMLLLGGLFAVDSFLLLSGLLVTWSFFKHLDSRNGKLNVLLLYFHRYIRLTPPFAVLILLSLSLLKHFGDGPLWNVYLAVADKPCRTHYWSALLYVQNYVNPSAMCIGHSWYLSVDMQLFFLSPIIVYPLWRWRRKFIWVVPLLILLSMGCAFSTFMVNKLTTKIMTSMMSGDTMIKTYYPTHIRMGPWLVGVLLAYILHNLKDRVTNIPKIYVAFGWIIAAGTMLSIIFGIYPLQQPDYRETVLEMAFYESCSRVCWSISLSWIIFACIHGYGGPVSFFLSLPHWQPLARLSYSIYLVHLPIQLLFVASSRTSLRYSDFLAIEKFWGDFGITLTVAIFWTLAFESPVIALEKIFFSKFTQNSNTTNSREDLVDMNVSCTEDSRSLEGTSVKISSNKN